MPALKNEDNENSDFRAVDEHLRIRLDSSTINNWPCVGITLLDEEGQDDLESVTMSVRQAEFLLANLPKIIADAKADEDRKLAGGQTSYFHWEHEDQFDDDDGCVEAL